MEHLDRVVSPFLLAGVSVGKRDALATAYQCRLRFADLLRYLHELDVIWGCAWVPVHGIQVWALP